MQGFIKFLLMRDYRLRRVSGFVFLNRVTFAFMSASSRAVFTEPQNAIQQDFYRFCDPDFSGAHQCFDAWQKQHPEDLLSTRLQAASQPISSLTLNY
jgi:hypothetical protein